MEDHLKKIQENSGPIWNFFKEISSKWIFCLKEDNKEIIIKTPIKGKNPTFNIKLLKKKSKISNQNMIKNCKPSKKLINLNLTNNNKNVYSFSKAEEQSLKKINELLQNNSNS